METKTRSTAKGQIECLLESAAGKTKIIPAIRLQARALDYLANHFSIESDAPAKCANYFTILYQYVSALPAQSDETRSIAKHYKQEAEFMSSLVGDKK